MSDADLIAPPATALTDDIHELLASTHAVVATERVSRSDDHGAAHAETSRFLIFRKWVAQEMQGS